MPHGSDVPTGAPKMFGAKVVSCSASIGWGGQGGSCQMTLVEDPRDGSFLDLPTPGTACFFAYHGFYFGGVFQRWSYKESSSGKLYDIVLESPSKLLDGIQIIMDEFQGTNYTESVQFQPYNGQIFDNQIDNVWNPFGELENYSAGEGRSFGNANVNAAGFPVGKDATKPPNATLTLLHGIQYIGNGNGRFGGKAHFGESYYGIDVEALHNAVVDTEGAEYYRIKGPVQSLNGVLSDITEAIQVDYFVDVTEDPPRDPEFNGGGIIEEPILRVRIADKQSQPSLGVISAYVEDGKATGRLVSSNIGQEGKNATTQKVLIGGPASRWYPAGIGSAYSVWGSLGNNAAYILGGYASVDYNNLNTRVPITLDEESGSPSPSYTATMFELRMALGGMAAWETFKVFQTLTGVEPNGYNVLANAPWIGAVEVNKWVLSKFRGQGGGGRAHVADNIDLAASAVLTGKKAYLTSRKDLSKSIHAAVNRVATSFYGQVFMVPLPFEPGGIDNNLRFINEDVQYEAAWEISDSAWTTVKHIADWSFYDGDGRLKSAAVWPQSGLIDYSPLGGDHAIATGGIASSKGGPDKDIFWIGGIPYVIVRTGSQLRYHDSLTTPDFGLIVLAAMFFGYVINAKELVSVGKQSVQVPIPPAAALPSYFGVPQESKRYTWGPWYAFSAKNGKAEVEVDSSMRPETFGSTAIMDNAAFASVVSGLATVDPTESGTMELAEFPAFNMGDRFGGSGPYVTNMDINIDISGCKTTYKFSTWTPSFGKLTKYNIDRVSKMNKANIAFMHAQRGRFNKRPFPKIPFKPTDFTAEKLNGAMFGRAGMELLNGFFRIV